MFLGFRPRVGLSAGITEAGGEAGEQLFQWTTSVLGFPDLKVPVLICRQDFPNRSKMGKGPSATGERGVVFARLTKTCVAVAAAGGKYVVAAGGRVWAGSLWELALTRAMRSAMEWSVGWSTARSPGTEGTSPYTASAGVACNSEW